MSNEKKTLFVTVIFGAIDVVFKILNIVDNKNIFNILSILFSIGLMVILIILYCNYRTAVDEYEFIKFLFFGSEYNGFNFFPKLKVFMDYMGNKNLVEIETLEFECVSDNNKKTSDITWIMKNVYNRTKK